MYVCMCVCVCVYVCVSTFSNIFSENTGPIEARFMWSLHGMGERKFVQTVLVTWSRWPPCPYMVKTLKNLFLWNQKADDLETWYAASGARVLPNLFKWWLWVDLDLFYGKVKFGPLRFCMGKRWNIGFFRNYCRVWFETSNRWLKWQEVSIDIQTLAPWGYMPPCPGAIYMHLIMKKFI